MPLPLLGLAAKPLIGAGIGALTSLFGGGKSKAQKQAERDYLYWTQRQRDQEAQAAADAASTREPALAAYNEIYGDPGYSAEEQAGLYRTPEEREAILVSPEEEAGLLRRAGMPAAGAANRAIQNLLRYRSAAGNFAPGLSATMEEIQRERGRQASEAALDTRLNIAGERRRAHNLLAQERMGTVRDIGQTRLRGREVGAAGRLNLASLDQSRLMGFSPNVAGQYAPPNYPSTWQNVAQGAIQGGIANLPSWRTNRTASGTGINDDQLIGAGNLLLRPQRQSSNLLYSY